MNETAGELYFAQIHGLTVASEFQLPGWSKAIDAGHVDIRVRRGKVEPNRPGAIETFDGHLVSPGMIDIRHPEGLICRVENGNLLTVDASNGGEHLIHFVTQGVAVSALLFQRGLYPLHGSCVAWGEKALAVCAHSGRGKSTLTAQLVRTGFSFLTDDRIVPVVEDDRVLALPGLPCLNLGDESARVTGFATENRTRFPAGRGKWHYHAPEFFFDRPAEIGMVAIMDWSDEPSRKRLEKLEGIEALAAIREQVNYEDLLRRLGLEAGFIMIASALLKTVPVFRFRPRHAIEDLSRNADELKALFLEYGS